MQQVVFYGEYGDHGDEVTFQTEQKPSKIE